MHFVRQVDQKGQARIPCLGISVYCFGEKKQRPVLRAFRRPGFTERSSAG